MLNRDDYEFLSNYIEKPTLKKVLMDAYKFEQDALTGIKVREASFLKAKISSDTGFWEMELTVDHGKVFYKFFDKQMTVIEISTQPTKEYLKDNGNYTEEEIEEILSTDLKRTYHVDLMDADSKNALKKNVADDFVLKNIRFDEKYNASNQIILNIKMWRKYFMSYIKDFSFLWESTNYKSASDLCLNMKKMSLI